MPNGKTHDAITIILAVPTFIVTYKLTNSWSLAAFTSGAFLFGGLMFGPDLDTHSVEYTRWSIFRFLWLPYKLAFAHRSRWSHGLIFGTIIRVIYFAGILTIIGALSSYAYFVLMKGGTLEVEEIKEVWQRSGMWTELNLGNYAMSLILLGLWLGAASHTLSDIIGTFLKTGKIKDFL